MTCKQHQHSGFSLLIGNHLLGLVIVFCKFRQHIRFFDSTLTVSGQCLLGRWWVAAVSGLSHQHKMIIIFGACLRWGSLVNNISLISVRVAFWSGYYTAPVRSPSPTLGQLGSLAVPLDCPSDPCRQLRLVHPAPEQSIRNCPELKKWLLRMIDHANQGCQKLKTKC